MQLEEGTWNARSNVGEQKQALATILANMSSLTVGAMFSVAMHNSKMNDDVGSCLHIEIASILGLLLSYASCECYGRKATLYLCILPFIICLVLIKFVEKQVWMRIVLCLEIFGGAMWSFTLPLYVSEISCNSRRGALVSVHVIFIYFGRKIAELLGLKWTILQSADIFIFFPVIAMIGMHWLPESPIFLVKASRIDEATRSLLWLRDNDEGCVQDELLRMKQTVQGMSNSGSFFGDGIATIKDLFAVPENRRCFVITLGLLTGQAVILWDGTPWRFNLLVSHHDDATNLITSTITPVLGAVLATILVDFLGRRSLLLISCIIVSLKWIIYFHKGSLTTGDVDDVTMSALKYTTSTAYFLGLHTLPQVIATEIFQRKVLPLAFIICLIISWIVKFIYIWIFMSDVSKGGFVGGPAGLVLCLCLLLFIYFHVPETKGKAIE